MDQKPSADDWGHCPACETPLSRANASRLFGAVVHIGCPKNGGEAPDAPKPMAGVAPDLPPAGLKIDVQSAPPTRPARRRVSLAAAPAPTTAVQDRFSEVGIEDLAREVARAAAEPKADVVLQAGIGPDGTEIVEPPPLAQPEVVHLGVPGFPDDVYCPALLGLGARIVADPKDATCPACAEIYGDPAKRAAREEALVPVHVLVPGFPGHCCCAEPIEAPTPASKGKEGKEGKPGTPVTADRTKATCSDCLETYDDAEALAVRIDELRYETETDEERNAREIAEEIGLEVAERKRRDAEQLAAIDASRKVDGVQERQPGAQVHIFDGFPELRAERRGLLETRCGILVRVPDILSGIYSIGLDVVPYSDSHIRCCRRCGEVPARSGARSHGAFVPPDRIVDLTKASEPDLPVKKSGRRRR